MDLYDRLVELQGMTHLLIDDVALLRPKVGELDPNVTAEEKANRRFYVRAVFALVEAFVEQHRRLLLELCESSEIELKEKTRKRLREIKEVFSEDGTVEEHEQYLQIFAKIKEVYKAAGIGFGQPLKVTFGDWNQDLRRGNASIQPGSPRTARPMELYCTPTQNVN
jgi:hypothetical protein